MAPKDYVAVIAAVIAALAAVATATVAAITNIYNAYRAPIEARDNERVKLLQDQRAQTYTQFMHGAWQVRSTYHAFVRIKRLNQSADENHMHDATNYLGFTRALV